MPGEFKANFELKYDERRKYYMRTKQYDVESEEVYKVLINCVSRSGWLECQTLGLVQLNSRITDSHNETVMLSDKIIHELLAAIREHIVILFRVCEGIALLDMIAAFGQSAILRDYTRPEFGDTLALKEARHPISELVRWQKNFTHPKLSG